MDFKQELHDLVEKAKKEGVTVEDILETLESEHDDLEQEKDDS